MGRLKKVEPEAVATETAAKKPAVKTVEAVHTIKYSEPVTVPFAEPEADEADEAGLEVVEFEEDDTESKPRPLSPRARLREKLSRLGVTNQALKLRIDRLPLYDVNGQSGINAEKDYIRTTACTEAFFDSDDYLEHLRSFGPGTYWLTLRGGKSIVAQWQERIGGAPLPSTSAENPSPEIYQAAAPVDPFTALLKQAKQFAELRKLFAPESEAPPRAVANDGQQTTEQALFTLMNADNGLVDVAAGKLRQLLRGNGSNSNDTEKGWLDVLYMAIERDTLPKLVNQFASQFRPGAAGATSATQPTAPAEQSAPDAVAYQRLVSVLVNCARTNSDVIPALQAIDGFVALFPEHAGAVDGFLNAPIEMALPALAQSSPMAAEVVAMPHAAEWFTRLKAAYFEVNESEGSADEGLQQNA